MTDLGAFDERIRSWRAILASIPRPDARLKTFVLAANDIACCTARGLPIAAAADVLHEIAETQDLIETFGADEVQSIIGNAFDNVERVPDLLELPPPKPKTNGHDPAGAKSRTGLLLKKFSELLLSTVPNYLIKGLLPRTGIAVVWGAPKSGKSFWVFDAAMHVALGWIYRGRKVRQGTVVYLALEGGGGFTTRVEAWRRHHQLTVPATDVPFYLIDVPLDLIAKCAVLIEAIKQQIGSGPILIVVDTLNRALAGDENKSDDMAKFIRAVDELRNAFGCLVILVHHCGIAGNRPRGHTSLPGADDVQISVVRGKDDTIVATVDHMKDGDAGAPLGFKLERVRLGPDDDGDEITSCVVVDAELSPAEAKLPDSARLALRALQEVLAVSGAVPPVNNYIPARTLAVSAIEWREAYYRTHPADKQDTKQKAFVRASLLLQERGVIGLYSDKVWIARHAGHQPDTDK